MLFVIIVEKMTADDVADVHLTTVIILDFVAVSAHVVTKQAHNVLHLQHFLFILDLVVSQVCEVDATYILAVSVSKRYSLAVLRELTSLNCLYSPHIRLI